MTIRTVSIFIIVGKVNAPSFLRREMRVLFAWVAVSQIKRVVVLDFLTQNPENLRVANFG